MARDELVCSVRGKVTPPDILVPALAQLTNTNSLCLELASNSDHPLVFTVHPPVVMLIYASQAPVGRRKCKWVWLN